uniref:Ribosomal protein S7 domain-containing protein n=1 Tax=Lactuca sativa TaxID=4236 RepID=A0A9R1VKN8_LACSA|nr:hypothetical protein LSAT_V11C500228620 [Lactuca sativa]
MMHGRNNDKKLVVVRIFKHAMEIIHLLTDANPIQIIVDAVINRLWIWSSQFKGEDNPCDRNLFINTSYAYQVKSLKLEIPSFIATDESISVIFQELQRRKENSTCLVALGTDDGEVFIINATSVDRIAALSFANKGRKLCAISTDGTTCEMNSETGELLKEMKISNKLISSSVYIFLNAALLTARAGAQDPSAIPSICRVSASLQYPAGLCGVPEACVLEDLAKAINLVHIRRDLVESGHALLNHAYLNLKEYKRNKGGTRICDSDGIGICDSIPMPNKRSLILSEGGTRISDSDGNGICDYVGIRIYDSIPLPNQRNFNYM